MDENSSGDNKGQHISTQDHLLRSISEKLESLRKMARFALITIGALLLYVGGWVILTTMIILDITEVSGEEFGNLLSVYSSMILQAIPIIIAGVILILAGLGFFDRPKKKVRMHTQ